MHGLTGGIGIECNHVFAARGRSLARLIEGLSNGDPVAWSITIGVVVLIVGISIYKYRNNSSE